MSEEEINKKDKDIEVITGDGKDLNISPVYDHIKLDKPSKEPNNEKDKKIVIPQSNKKSES